MAWGDIMRGLAGAMQGYASGVEEQRDWQLKQEQLKKQEAMNEWTRRNQAAQTALGFHKEGYQPMRAAQGQMAQALAPSGVIGAASLPTNLPYAVELAKSAQDTVDVPDMGKWVYNPEIDPEIQRERRSDARADRSQQQVLAVLGEKEKADRAKREEENKANYVALRELATQLGYKSDLTTKPYDAANAANYGKMLDILSKQADRRAQVQSAAAGKDKLVPVLNDDGTVTYTPESQAAGKKVGKVGGLSGIAKGISAQAASQVARTFGGLSEMDNARQFMNKYEDDLARGEDDEGNPMSLSGVGAVLKQTLGALGTDVNHQIVGTPAFAALAAVDPRLAEYIRFGMSFGEGEGLISNRPSDFRQKVSQFLSTAKAGMGKESYGNIRARRDAIVDAVGGAMSSAVPEAARATSEAIAGGVARAAAEKQQSGARTFTNAERARRWQELKNSGMKPEQATLQVKREMP